MVDFTEQEWNELWDALIHYYTDPAVSKNVNDRLIGKLAIKLKDKESQPNICYRCGYGTGEKND